MKTLVKGHLLAIIILVVSFIFVPKQLLAQSEAASTDSILSRMTKQLMVYPQEKLHIHTDKPFYISGESIWFRAHLVDAMSHQHDTTSLYVYGELINPLDSIVDRIKIKSIDKSYGGRFILDEEYPAGTYTMRFYTRFLENLGEDYFFSKSVNIGGPLSTKYKTDINYSYEKNDIKIDFQFINQETDEKISPSKIAVAYDKMQFEGYDKENLTALKVDDNQIASLKVNAKKNPIKSLYIEYEHNDDFHAEFIPISASNDDFYVDFFPEGGDLISDIQMNIGFKALRSDGFSENVTGTVFSQDGDSITSFSTAHNGMGLFPFLAKSGNQYYAVCKMKEGKSKRFDLPLSVEDGYSLSVQGTSNILLITPQRAGAKPIEDNLVLLIHCKGQVIHVSEWNKDVGAIQMSRHGLPAGVLHAMLVNENYEPVAERLFFNLPSNLYSKIEQVNNKEKYSNRELVVSKFNFEDEEGNPIEGNFSVSVTDDRDVELDKTQNILTTLLLTSELKGYIENPSFYFENNRVATYALDLLMLTQGWRRYDMARVLQGEIEYPAINLEFSQNISGTVKGGIFLNRTAEAAPVYLLDQESAFALTTTTDENGRFMFRTMLPDSLILMVRTQTKKGGNRINLEVDNEYFPSLSGGLPSKKLKSSLFETYLKKADMKYVLENGMRMIQLADIEVMGDDKMKVKGKSLYSSPFNTAYTSEYFKRGGAHTLADALRKFPGVSLMQGGNAVSIKMNTEPALILVDQLESSDILSFNPNIDEIDEIEVVSGSQTVIFGTRGVNGVVLITTKRGEGPVKQAPNFNFKRIRPLGFQTPVEFYSPKYETLQQKRSLIVDLRSTVYWNPSVDITGGEAEIQFYTADKASQYSVFIDGVSSDGEPLHMIGKIGELDE